MALERVWLRPMKLKERADGRVIARGGIVRAGEVRVRDDDAVVSTEEPGTYMVGLQFSTGRIMAVKRGEHT